MGYSTVYCVRCTLHSVYYLTYIPTHTYNVGPTPTPTYTHPHTHLHTPPHTILLTPTPTPIPHTILHTLTPPQRCAPDQRGDTEASPRLRP